MSASDADGLPWWLFEATDLHAVTPLTGQWVFLTFGLVVIIIATCATDLIFTFLSQYRGEDANHTPTPLRTLARIFTYDEDSYAWQEHTLQMSQSRIRGLVVNAVLLGYSIQQAIILSESSALDWLNITGRAQEAAQAAQDSETRAELTEEFTNEFLAVKYVGYLPAQLYWSIASLLLTLACFVPCLKLNFYAVYTWCMYFHLAMSVTNAETDKLCAAV